MVIADEHCEDGGGDQQQLGQLANVVAGLAAQLAGRLQQLQVAELHAKAGEQQGWQPEGASSRLIARVPAPWPEALLPDPTTDT